MSEELKNNSYWKSLNELSKNEEYKKFAEREFPEDASELTDQVSRRSFLRVMGASIALAGFASCRRPVQKIMPFSQMPENIVQGEPLFYATAHPFQDVLNGLVVQNTDGRPTKLEGNEVHPASGGRSSIYDQAQILGLYDPDRSRAIRRDGEQATKEDFLSFAANHFSDTGRRVVVISEANSSPTLQRLRGQFEEQFANGSWVTYEPFDEENELEGTRMAFGRRLRTVNHFGQADVVVALDSDLMNPYGHKNSVANARELTGRRKVESTDDTLSRIYSVESTFTNTGSYADNRLRLKASEIAPFTFALAGRLSQSVAGLDAFSGFSNEFSSHDWIDTLADDLLANRGGSVVTAGSNQPAAVHAAVAAINLALGNEGETVSWHDVPHLGETDQREALREVIREMGSGQVDTVILLGTNPVWNAPADLGFGEALQRAETVIHLADYVDETSRVANWHINRAHFLEAWGDGRSFSGVRSVVQPQIQPLFGGWSELELMGTILNGEWANGYDLVQQTWQEFYTTNFENRWERVLHDGVDTADAFEAASASLASGFRQELAPHLDASGVSGIEITIKPDSTLFDGRYANNSWLQELPDPMTKITWDNVALMSPATARELGIATDRHLSDKEAPVVRIEAGGEAIEIAAWVQPGHVDGSITLTAGYGRTGIGRVADGVGVNTWPLRTSGALYAQAASVEVTGRSYEIACTQDHHSLEGRDMIREATIDEYRETPDFASYEKVHGYEVPGLKESAAAGDGEHPVSLFNPRDFPDNQPQWGMAIDLNACFGCGVCTIACQAENNIPVVGKREVGRRRVMHWIRTDRYYEGSEENPRALHQPVPCMHCDLAPCEQVCPVAATTQSDDGMNQMAYNRCIGTRYCANNCPYKVRRFNFFNYSKEFLANGDEPEIVQMAMNPDVTVRFRGVMEKCTYCVQRVNRAKSKARLATGSRKPADGAVQTACQQACPANAISFGDLTDQSSEVSRQKQNDRNYVMLEELSVRPRTSYLGKLSNPNPEVG
ncbi:MAG: TAT-variant-translocated molybdopterin oxidoreductase [Balneolaceae bacterium]